MSNIVSGKIKPRILKIRRILQRERGMTLIEIMVVIAILGIMATTITIQYVRYLDQSRVDATKIQAQSIIQAMQAYKIQYGKYPSTEEGLDALVSKGVMKALPMDKWGQNFEYIRNNANSFTLKSYGADGAAGGEGFDADLIFEE